MSDPAPVRPDLASWRASGAAQVDAIGWHYIETLAQRASEHSGPAQHKLLAKLQEALQQLEVRMATATQPRPRHAAMPSPLACMLQDMGVRGAPLGTNTPDQWAFGNPRIEEFKKQLSRISVAKQVNQALSQAPHNAGPINSHMLVLRSLELMRDISPDYLNRFVGYVDTLIFIDSPEIAKVKTRKAATARAS